MKIFAVDLGERSYPIYIGEGLLHQPRIFEKHLTSKQVMVVTNETIAPLYLDAVLDSIHNYQCKSVILPDGEQYKNLETVNKIYDALLENRFNRDCTLVALGGGVVGDITGFAAATYQRGVNFIQAPTTLLAQVDSSVGGKTGVNHRLGKNMIGAFHQPQCVLVDTTTLDTLDDKQLSAGIAEVIKYGLIRDRGFYDWLESNLADLLARDAEAIAYTIEKSCANKAEIVSVDELEHGMRALLNLGHTFGHAIETALGYGKWLHGEAVAVGMLMAADLSQRHGWIDSTVTANIEDLLLKAKLPVRAPRTISAEKFLALMAIDKKVTHGDIILILLDEIGKAIVTGDYDHSLLLETLTKHPASPLL